MSNSTLDHFVSIARAGERRNIIRFIREKASEQNHYDKINLLAALACEIEGTEFVPDSMLGQDHDALVRIKVR